MDFKEIIFHLFFDSVTSARDTYKYTHTMHCTILDRLHNLHHHLFLVVVVISSVSHHI